MPNNFTWNGRVDPDPQSIRYHQKVQQTEMNNLAKNTTFPHFGLVGFSCDEGVRRNQGRVGAALAPNEIRTQLASLPYHLSKTEIIDVGNISCKDENLEEAQEELGETLANLYQSGFTPIIIGGGHETLYGHYLGVREYIGDESTLGIINIDAHFDLRKDQQPSSGTMFRQILDNDQNTGYLCLGIQHFGNTKSLFDAAKHYSCEYIFEEELEDEQSTKHTIHQFMEKYDYIILTLCMDVLNATAAPGVSAPSPFGLDPKVVRKLIRHIVGYQNVVSFDLSEVNPKVDEGDKTSKLAAYILAEAMYHFK